jgi:SAM-dependent methyltransferase
MTDATEDAADALLAAQYEAYPYPPRDPRAEARRLVVGSPGHLREIDYWVFGAARPAHRPLRALIAGGGTGDATIMLAQQMRDAGRPGRVTWLDRSAAALAIARARAEARGLDNIDWQTGSLLDLPNSGLGPFDYVDCCGVLHHLADPAAGLTALVSVLAPGGGVGLMVYAPYGRSGVTMAQEALRLLAPVREPAPARLDMAKRMLRHLPDSHALRHSPGFADLGEFGDAGLFDLLLNPRERSFTAAGLAALLAGQGLAIRCWMEPLRYDPATWLQDPKLRARAATLDVVQQAALAEMLTGNMFAHVVYATRPQEASPRPDPARPEAVPVLREGDGEALARLIRPEHTLPILFYGLRVPVPLPPLAGAILRLVDGRRSVAEIGDALRSRGIAEDAFTRAWQATFRALESVNHLLLAPPRVAA